MLDTCITYFDPSSNKARVMLKIVHACASSMSPLIGFRDSFMKTRVPRKLHLRHRLSAISGRKDLVLHAYSVREAKYPVLLSHRDRVR